MTSTDSPTAPAPSAPSSESSPAQAARILLKQLQEQFSVFHQCLPLAIGIDKQIMARLPGTDRKLLRIALGIHTHSLRYLKTMEKATVRSDLDGNPAEEVTEAHRAHAQQTLQERFKKNAELRKAQRKVEETQRKADDAVRQRADKLNQLAAKFSKRG
jgi:ProP effector